MKSVLVFCSVLIGLSFCSKDDALLKLSSRDKEWAPYTEGQIIFFENEIGDLLEAKVIEVTDSDVKRTNVIDLKDVGVFHIEVVSTETQRKVQLYFTDEGYNLDHIPLRSFSTDISMVDPGDDIIGAIQSTKNVTFLGRNLKNVVRSRMYSKNGFIETYIARGEGFLAMDDRENTGKWVHQ